MTISPGLELQGLIIATLKASASVSALVDGVYDRPPQASIAWGGPKQAYISLGPTDIVVEDGDCIYGENHNVQIDVWSRTVGQVDTKKIVAAIKGALHDQAFSFTDNGFVEMLLKNYRIMADPDGMTTHGSMQFECMIDAS